MGHIKSIGILATAFLLVSCGGGGDGFTGSAFPGAGSGQPTSPPTTPTPLRGSLIEASGGIALLTGDTINAASARGGYQAVAGKAKCNVKVMPIYYHTIGPNGESTNASGVLLLPYGPVGNNNNVPECMTASSLVAYAKSTDVQKPRTLANPQDPETLLLAAIYSSQGYAVVATDYLGYARSTFPYHPYLNADSEASSVIDSIRAARQAAAERNLGGSLSGKVMLLGYSQGGHSSMAAQRVGERDAASELNIVAAAHLAGPYNVSGQVKSPDAILGYQFIVPFMVTAYQKVYGNVYSDVNTAFKPPYASNIASLLPSPTLNYATLVSTGALPGANNETPNQARDELFQGSFLADVQTNPSNTLYLDAKKNDLFGWSPKATTLLCGGAGDPTVPPALHLIPLKANFDSRGVTTVSTLDVDAQVQATYGPGGHAPTDSSSTAYATYYSNYHGTYEPPFCHLAARQLFDSVK